MEDEKLMLRYARQGDISAFEELFRRYRGMLFGYLVRQTGEHSAAEDLCQEVFLRVIRNASSYTVRAAFRTWLFTIARNLVIDYRRKTNLTSGRNVPVERFGEIAVDSRGNGPDNPAASGEIREILEKTLQTLPEEQREVFLLRELSGMDFKTIARVTSTPVSTVKSRMRYALMRLKEAFSRQGIVPGRKES